VPSAKIFPMCRRTQKAYSRDSQGNEFAWFVAESRIGTVAASIMRRQSRLCSEVLWGCSIADEGSQSAGGQPSTTKQTKKPTRKGGLFCLPGRMGTGIEAAGRGAAAGIRRGCLAAAGARRAVRFPQPQTRGGPGSPGVLRRRNQETLSIP